MLPGMESVTLSWICLVSPAVACHSLILGQEVLEQRQESEQRESRRRGANITKRVVLWLSFHVSLAIFEQPFQKLAEVSLVTIDPRDSERGECHSFSRYQKKGLWK
jgi:hypothetical protein